MFMLFNISYLKIDVTLLFQKVIVFWNVFWRNNSMHHFHQIIPHLFVTNFFHQKDQDVMIPTTSMYYVLQHHTNGLIKVHFFPSNHNICLLITEFEVSCLQSNMCSFVVRPCKRRSQPINIRRRSDIESLIFFHLFDVGTPSSTLLYFFV